MRIEAHHEDGRVFDITEAVGHMYETIRGSMDWGSGFLSIEDVTQIMTVASACEFETYEQIEEQMAGYFRGVERCPLCRTGGPNLKVGVKRLNDWEWTVTWPCGHSGRIFGQPGEPHTLVMPTDPPSPVEESPNG